MDLQITPRGDLEFVSADGQVCTIGGELIGGSPDYPMSKLFEEFFDTTVGEKFLEEYGLATKNQQTGEPNSAAIERLFAKLYAHDPRPTVSRIADTVNVAIKAGELTRKAVTDTSSRGPKGRFISDHERLRAEVRRLLDDSSISADSIRDRANRDRAFGDAFRAELSLAPMVNVKVVPSEELSQFAQDYTYAPSLKPVAGYVELANKKYSVADFTRKVEEAIAAGWLR